MTRRISCVLGRHAWSSVYDPERHESHLTCRHCGTTKVALVTDQTRMMDASGPGAMQGGPGIGGL